MAFSFGSFHSQAHNMTGNTSPFGVPQGLGASLGARIEARAGSGSSVESFPQSPAQPTPHADELSTMFPTPATSPFGMGGPSPLPARKALNADTFTRQSAQFPAQSNPMQVIQGMAAMHTPFQTETLPERNVVLGRLQRMKAQDAQRNLTSLPSPRQRIGSYREEEGGLAQRLREQAVPQATPQPVRRPDPITAAQQHQATVNSRTNSTSNTPFSFPSMEALPRPALKTAPGLLNHIREKQSFSYEEILEVSQALDTLYQNRDVDNMKALEQQILNPPPGGMEEATERVLDWMG